MGATGALLAVSVGMQAISGMQQSSAQKSEGAFQSQQLTANSRIANLQADDAIFRGDRDAKDHKADVKRLIGAQRAAAGAQGIEVNSGSALDVQADAAGEGEIDALTIKNNAFREAWGYRVQASDYQTQAEFAKLSASNKSRNTILTTGMNIISTGADTYYKSKSGTTGTKKAAA